MQNSLQTEVTVMQMKHQPIIFHARGFFTIDYKSMWTVIAMMD